MVGPIYELYEAVKVKAARALITGDGIPDGIYVPAAGKYSSHGTIVIYINNEQRWTKDWHRYGGREQVIDDARAAWAALTA